VRAWIGLFLVWGSLFPAAWAAEDSVSVKAELDRAFVTIGDRVEYRITVRHGPTVQIISDLVPPASEGFEVKEVHEFSEKEGKELVQGRRIVLTGYQLGEFILEPVTVKYRTARGDEKSIQTNRLYVTIQSVEPSEKAKTDIRGPKGVIEIPRSWRGLWGLVLTALAAGAGIYLWWRKKRRRGEGGSLQEPALSPEDEALLRLNRLFDSDLLKRGKLKEYFLELSEVLRAYFERRFEILAIESTTSEILRDLKEKEVPGELRREIEEVLEAADLVKFAKWKPLAADIVKTNQKAKGIIEMARPRQPEPGTPSSEAAPRAV
jgi:hypothetical protein